MNIIEILRRPLTKKILLVIVAILLLFFLAKYVIPVFLVVLSLVIAVVVALMKLKWFGLETSTMTIIILGMVFGPKVGLIMGFVMVILQLVFGQTIGPYIVWVVPGYAIGGLVAGLLGPSNVVFAGIAIVICLHVVFAAFTALFTPGALPKYGPYAISNVIVNVLLFRFVAPVLVGLMV